jgi:hypothetical protein
MFGSVKCEDEELFYKFSPFKEDRRRGMKM